MNVIPEKLRAHQIRYLRF